MYRIYSDYLIDSIAPNPDILIYTVVDEDGYCVKQFVDVCRAYAFIDMMNARDELRTQ